MSTKDTLAARISDDLARSDITSQINSAIDDAIESWKCTRFAFNETRAVTFTTTAAQSIYTVADNGNIPLFFNIDGMYCTPSGGTAKWMGPKSDFDETHDLILTAAGTGEPYRWSWFDRSIYLYPIPDVSTYSMRVIGAIEKAGPATGPETDNVWLLECFSLLRAHAKGLVYLHTTQNPAMAMAMLGPNFDGRGGVAGAAYKKLRRETTDKRALGVITPSAF